MSSSFLASAVSMAGEITKFAKSAFRAVRGAIGTTSFDRLGSIPMNSDMNRALMQVLSNPAV